MKKFHDIIKEISNEENIQVTFLSSKWVIKLEKNNLVKYIYGYKFPLNDHSVGSILDDKSLFYDVLINNSIPVIEHFVIYKDYDKETVCAYFKKNNNTLIVKGNVGTCGNEVYKVDNINDLFNTINELFKSQYSISLCPFYDIKCEYRLIILNKKVELIYAKTKQIVIGNGHSTLQELAIKYNKDYYSNHEIFNKDKVLNKNELYLLNFKFNLSNGCRMSFDIDNEIKDKLKEISNKIINVIDINFGSIDIILSDNNLLVMEANSGVMMNNLIKQNGIDGHNIAKEIYKKAIKSMWEMKK